MGEEQRIKLYALTLDARDNKALAQFYAELLGWVIVFSDDDYAAVAPPNTAHGGYPCITIQQNDDYRPPVWPAAPGAQQAMAHLDFAVADVEKAVEHAVRCGASVAKEQLCDDWTVMLDPAGHPFCLCKAKALFESPGFALR